MSVGKRMIGYLENWSGCVTDGMLAPYTHIKVAFAVDYMWNAAGNVCSSTCTLQPLLGCNNLANVAALVAQVHSLGKRISVSVGGAGMGGSWNLTHEKIRNGLPPGKELSHVPMDSATDVGDGYYSVLQQTHQYLDFVAIQYYNGFIYPAVDIAPALTHYQNVVTAMGGDANKVVFGKWG